MQNDLIKDLKRLAQDILLLEESFELGALRLKSQEINEKLAILDFLNKKFSSDTESKTLAEIKNDFHKETIHQIEEKYVEIQIVEEYSVAINPEVKEKPHLDSFEAEGNDEQIGVKQEEDFSIKDTDSLDEFFVPTFESVKEDFSVKEEFKNTVSLDDTENLFVTKKTEIRQLSLNDRLLGNTIQVGLNDRIAFVNQLFNFSQSEFNKVLTTLNDFKTLAEAKNYINITLKQKYNWKGKEEILDRFLFLVERKFL